MSLSMWERLKPAFLLLLSVSGIAGLISRQKIDAAINPLLPEAFAGWGLSAVLLVILTLTATYSFFLTLRYRRMPLRVIESRCVLRFQDPDGTRVRAQWFRLLRANHPNVQAYFFWAHPDPPGKIPKDSVTYAASPDVPCLVELIGNEATRWEMIFMFASPLPYVWYLPLIPSPILRFAWSSGFPHFLKKLLTGLDVWITYEGDYDRPDPVHELLGNTSYLSQRVYLDLHFHPERTPSREAIMARLIQVWSVSALKVDLCQDDGKSFYRIEVPRMTNERVRVSWTLPQIPPTDLTSSHSKEPDQQNSWTRYSNL